MRNRNLSCLAILCVAVLTFAVGVSAQTGSDTTVVVRVGDVLCLDGQSNVPIPVYVENRSDEIGAFQMVFRLDRTDLGVFEEIGQPGYVLDYFNYVYTMYGPEIDLSTVYWEGDYQLGLEGGMPIPPGTRTEPLLSCLFNANDLPDEQTDRVIEVALSDIPGEFGLFDAFGDAIAPSGYTVVFDTTYYLCAAWLPGSPDVCMSWMVSTADQFDSAYVYIDTFPIYTEDSGYVFQTGTITIVPPVCGNIDNSLDGVVDISDLSRYIDFLFLSFKPVDFVQLGDVDAQHDGIVDIADLTRMIDHLFISFAALECGT